MNKIRTYIRYVVQIAVCTLLMACMCVHGMDHNDTPQQYRHNFSHNSDETPHFDDFDSLTIFDSPTIGDENFFQPFFGFNPDRADNLENNSTGDFMGDENVGIPQEEGYRNSAEETSNADFNGDNRDFSFDFVAPYPETRQEEGHGNNGTPHDDVGNSQNAPESVNDSHESPIGHINLLSPHSHSHMSPLSNPFDEEISGSPIDLPPGDVIDGESYENSISNEQETTDSNQQQGVETTAVETGEATLETNENHENTPQCFTTNSAMSVSNLSNDTATLQSLSNTQFHMGPERLTSLFRGIRGHDSHPIPVEQALKADEGVLNKREEYVPYFNTSQPPRCPICMVSITHWQDHVNSAYHKSNEAHFKSNEYSICAPYARCKDCGKEGYTVSHHAPVNCKPASLFDSQSIRSRVDWAVKHGRGYIVVGKKRNRMYRPYFSKDKLLAYCPVCDIEVRTWVNHLLMSRGHENNVSDKNITPCSKKAQCIECNSFVKFTFDHHCKYSRAAGMQGSTSNATSTGGSSLRSRDKGKEHVDQSDDDYASGTHSNFFNQHGSDNGYQNRANQLTPVMTGLHSNIVPSPDRSQPSRKRRRDSDNHHNKEPRRGESNQARENSVGMSDTVTSDKPVLEKRRGFLNGEKKYVPYFDTSQRPYCPVCMISVVNWQGHLKAMSHASNEKYFTSDGSSMCARYARCTDCNKDVSNTLRHTPLNCKPTSESGIRDRIAWAVQHGRGYIIEDEKINRMYRPYFGKNMPHAYCPVCNTEVKTWTPHLKSSVHKNNVAGNNITPCSKIALCKECGNTRARYLKPHLAICSKAKSRKGGHETSSLGVASQEPSVSVSNVEYQSDAEQFGKSLDEILAEDSPDIDDIWDDELSDG